MFCLFQADVVSVHELVISQVEFLLSEMKFPPGTILSFAECNEVGWKQCSTWQTRPIQVLWKLCNQKQKLTVQCGAGVALRSGRSGLHLPHRRPSVPLPGCHRHHHQVSLTKHTCLIINDCSAAIYCKLRERLRAFSSMEANDRRRADIVRMKRWVSLGQH